MQDPIQDIATALETQPFETKSFSNTLHGFVGRLTEARQYFLGPMRPKEISEYNTQREVVWEKVMAEKLIPEFTAENPEVTRYVRALQTLFLDAYFITHGYRAGSLRSHIATELERVFDHHAVTKAGTGAPMESADLHQHLRDWQYELDTLKSQLVAHNGLG